MGRLYKLVEEIKMSKLPDINYALMAQLSYLHWNNIKSKKRIIHQPIKTILLTDTILSQIKTDFYNDRKNYPSNEKLNDNGDNGELEQYTYHGEDKRLFLVYSTIKSLDNTKALFGEILNGWEYLDCSTGEIIQNKFFPPELLKEYKESGFFGVAFQRGNDIMIAYRGTEDKVKHNNILTPEDVITDVNIYAKETDIQQVEAVLFYEYIKATYGEGKNIHITGHSLAGAIAQYVHFYAKCNGDDVVTLTWNGLGSFGSIITSLEFSLTEKIKYSSDNTLLAKEFQLKAQKLFRDKINSIMEYQTSQSRLKSFYSLKTIELLKKRKDSKNSSNLFNYFMAEDFVGGYLNGDWLGEKKSIDVPEDNLQNILNDLVENTKELKNKELSEHLEDLKDNINEIGKDIICPVLNLFDDDGLTENIKDNLNNLRRSLEKQVPIIEKALSAIDFHSVNNFLVFMTDEGNINFYEMRKEFRFNALKTIVIKKKEKNYRFLKGKNRNNPSEDILEIKNQDVERQIFFPANRLVVGNVFTPFPITQTDILFKENFVKKKFNGSDMEVIENKLDGAYTGEIILGKYTNLNELGGIIGQSPLIIKIYPISLGEEEKLEEKEQKVISFGITRTIHSLS
jgi:hypothetical protein